MEQLAGSILVGLISFLALTWRLRVITENISKQIREQIDADREQRFWNIRVDAILELHSVFTNTTDLLTLGRIQEVNDRIYPIIMNISMLFKSENFVGKSVDALSLLENATDGNMLPINKHEEFGKLLLDVIDGGYEKLGAFK